MMFTGDDLRIVGRLATGRPLNGERKTNARWKVRGTELRDGHEHAGWWAHLSLRRRAGIRLGALVWLVANAYALVTNFDQAVVTLRVEFWLVFALCIWWTVHRYRKYALREVAASIGLVVVDWLGWSRHIDPLELVKLPMGFRTNPDKPIEISLPRGHVETDRRQKQLAGYVANHAGLKSHDYEVLIGEGEAPKMFVRAKLVPPDEVLWAEDDELRTLIYACQDDSILCVGRGLYGKPVWIDWKRDSPHLALSWGSGAGKSTMIRFLAAQTVYKGGRAVIMDGGKDGESHEDWTRDQHLQLIDGVEFYPSIAEEHDALIAWEQERQRRSQAKLARTGESFQRVLMVLEERNVTKARLQAHWATIREQGDPVKSPALQAIANLVNAGRSVGINCVASAQRFDAACIGGGDVRGSFQLRSLSRWDEQARKMLIPDITPKPTSSSHPGRAILVVAGELTDFQAPLLTAKETVDLCYAGAEQTDRRIIAPRPQAPGLAGGPGESLGETPDLGLGQPAVEPAPARTLLTLNEAWKQSIVTGQLEGVRSAAKRDGFPPKRDEAPGGAYLYDATELANWEARRQLRSAPRAEVSA